MVYCEIKIRYMLSIYYDWNPPNKNSLITPSH